MCTSHTKSPNDCDLWCFLVLWYVGRSAPRCVDLLVNTCESDVLAFALIVSTAARLKTTGIKVSALLATIAEDSTLYSMFIFASQFALTMTLILGRVSSSRTVPDSPSELQQIKSDACLYRNQSSFFRRCKHSNTDWVLPFLPCFIFTIPRGNLACVLHLASTLFFGILTIGSDFSR